MDSLMDGEREKYVGLLRAGSDVENRWGSCGKRGFGWGFYIWKVMGRDVGKGGSQLIMICFPVFFRDPFRGLWKGFIHGII